MDSTLVPFGYRPVEDDFVDVGEVPRGRKSACICWSCRMPLVARQGDVKQWHFAHATRGTYRETQDRCEFSFFVSVRMMARQVVKGNFALDLPGLKNSVDCRPTIYSRPISIDFVVTEPRSIVLSGIEVDAIFNGVPVDLFGTIDGFTFVVYFIHPGRGVPSSLMPEHLTDRKCGVIAIDLRDVATLFTKRSGSGSSYAKVLEEFLAHHEGSKRWVFHPRYDHAKALAMKRQPTLTPRSQERPIASTSSRHGSCECVMCRVSWISTSGSQTVCPKCNSHLYVRIKNEAE